MRAQVYWDRRGVHNVGVFVDEQLRDGVPRGGGRVGRRPNRGGSPFATAPGPPTRWSGSTGTSCPIASRRRGGLHEREAGGWVCPFSGVLGEAMARPGWRGRLRQDDVPASERAIRPQDGSRRRGPDDVRRRGCRRVQARADVGRRRGGRSRPGDGAGRCGNPARNEGQSVAVELAVGYVAFSVTGATGVKADTWMIRAGRSSFASWWTRWRCAGARYGSPRGRRSRRGVKSMEGLEGLRTGDTCRLTRKPRTSTGT